MALQRLRHDDSTFACPVEGIGSSVVTGMAASGKSDTAALLAEQMASAGTPVVLFDQAGNFLSLLPQAGAQALTDAWNALQAVPAYAERYQRTSAEEVQA